jgi:spermidine synthase
MNSSGRGIPVIFHPVILLSGISSGIAFHIWFRMVTTLFGIHQFSITSVMATMLICLTMGSIIGGRLADKVPNNLALFAILQAIVSLSILFNPLIFKFLQNILSKIILDIHPASFGMGFIRIALSLFFLFPPVVSLGAIIPVLGRSFTHLINQSGNRISAILSASFAGISAGMMLSGFFLIPGYGMRYTLRVSSFISLFVLVSTLAYILITEKTETSPVNRTISSGRGKKNAMLFRKNKAVLETGAKLTRAMLRVHAVNGFVCSSLLILACRIMNNYAVIGLPYLYMLIFTVFFAGLALGGGFYRIITTRMVNGYLLMASLEFLNAFVMLFSLTLFSFSGPSLFLTAANAVPWWRTVAYQLVSVVSFMLLPGFVAGLLLPLAGRIYSRRILHLGRNIGKLGSLFYNGSLTGVIVTPFVLLPLAGSVYSCFILILVPLLCGLYLLFRDSRLIRGFRISYTAMTIACITGFLFLLIKSGRISSASDKNAEPIRNMREGSSARVSLVEKKGGLMSLNIDGIENLETGKKGIFNQQLPAFLSCILGPPIKSSLVIGFGMGLTASALETCNIPVIHIAEVFPEALTLSSEAFSDVNNDILTSSHVEIHIEDPRLLLLRDPGQLDLILSGFTDIRNVPGFFTDGFFQRCFSGLSDSGIMVQVLPLRGIHWREFCSIIKACADTFPEVSLWYISKDKVVLMAFKKGIIPNYCSIATRFLSMDQDGKLRRIGISDAGSLLARKLMDNQELKKFADGVAGNSDDKPLIEFSRTTRNYADTMLFNKLLNSLNDSEELVGEGTDCPEANKNILLEVQQGRTVIKKELLSVKSIP